MQLTKVKVCFVEFLEEDFALITLFFNLYQANVPPLFQRVQKGTIDPIYFKRDSPPYRIFTKCKFRLKSIILYLNQAKLLFKTFNYWFQRKTLFGWYNCIWSLRFSFGKHSLKEFIKEFNITSSKVIFASGSWFESASRINNWDLENKVW